MDRFERFGTSRSDLAARAAKAHVFAFNGDADGLCALHQLRLESRDHPRFITGVKRDIALLRHLDPVRDTSVTVLDITVGPNREPLEKILEQNGTLFWFDHHVPEYVPESPRFLGIIDTRADVNTSAIVDGLLEGRHTPWAVMGLYGDNLHAAADRLGRAYGLDPEQCSLLEEAGALINYNAYGETLDDLLLHPVSVLEGMSTYADPLDFIRESTVMPLLREGHAQDLRRSSQAERIDEQVYALPNEKWARRVVGAFANDLARREPDLAHAVLVDNGAGGFVVSVRSPLTRDVSAAALCIRFDTGGGRVKAAGINVLPADAVDRFVRAFRDHFRA